MASIQVETRGFNPVIGGSTSAFHQFRIRHLQEIRGVNLKPPMDKEELNGSRVVDDNDGVFYLTLHDPCKDVESNPLLQTAPKAGPNPVWPIKSFDEPFSACESIVVRLWAILSPLDSSGRLICSYCVNFQSLVPFDYVMASHPKPSVDLEINSNLSSKPPKLSDVFVENSLVFRLGGVNLVAPCCAVNEEVRKAPVKKWISRREHGAMVRPGYSVASVSRLRILGRALHQVLEDRTEVLSDLQQMEEETAEKQRLLEKIDSAEVRLGVLRRAKERLLASIRAKRQKKVALEEKNSDGGWVLMSRYQDLTRDRERMREIGLPAWAETRDNLLTLQVQMGLKRRKLLSQLSSIYPITKDQSNKWTIQNVHLPDGEAYLGHDDVRLSVAFGFVTHLCQLVSYLINVPLKYPAVFHGSRSSVVNHHGFASVKDNSFPLYDRRLNKQRFEYAAYLMNLNIAHLRNLCALATPDLRLTLANLATLINEVTPRHIPIPSGGPKEGSSIGTKSSPLSSSDQLRIVMYSEALKRSVGLAGPGPWRKFPLGGSHPNMTLIKDGHSQKLGVGRAGVIVQASTDKNSTPPPGAIHHSRSVSLEERQCRLLTVTMSPETLGLECGTEATECCKDGDANGEGEDGGSDVDSLVKVVIGCADDDLDAEKEVEEGVNGFASPILSSTPTSTSTSVKKPSTSGSLPDNASNGDLKFQHSA